MEEEEKTENTSRIAKCISIRAFLWLFWTTERCGEAGESQINGLELHSNRCCFMLFPWPPLLSLLQISSSADNSTAL